MAEVRWPQLRNEKLAKQYHHDVFSTAKILGSPAQRL
jgi:hypothetical protein